LTLAQLYSTASYQAHSLGGINLTSNELQGADLSGQNLSGAGFPGANLPGANFSQANLIRTDFYMASVVGANFTAADLRGAEIDLSQTTTGNTIQPNGHINGLDLQNGQSVVVRNVVQIHISPGDTQTPTATIPAIPITIDQHLNAGPGGALEILFDS